MESNTVKITPSVLKQQVEEGRKLDWLMEYYSLPKSQMQKALKQLGLKIRKLHKPKFEFVLEDEDMEAIQEELVSRNEEEALEEELFQNEAIVSEEETTGKQVDW